MTSLRSAARRTAPSSRSHGFGSSSAAGRQREHIDCALVVGLQWLACAEHQGRGGQFLLTAGRVCRCGAPLRVRFEVRPMGTTGVAQLPVPRPLTQSSASRSPARRAILAGIDARRAARAALRPKPASPGHELLGRTGSESRRPLAQPSTRASVHVRSSAALRGPSRPRYAAAAPGDNRCQAADSGVPRGTRPNPGTAVVAWRALDQHDATPGSSTCTGRMLRQHRRSAARAPHRAALEPARRPSAMPSLRTLARARAPEDRESSHAAPDESL